MIRSACHAHTHRHKQKHVSAHSTATSPRVIGRCPLHTHIHSNPWWLEGRYLEALMHSRNAARASDHSSEHPLQCPPSRQTWRVSQGSTHLTSTSTNAVNSAHDDRSQHPLWGPGGRRGAEPAGRRPRRGGRAWARCRSRGSPAGDKRTCQRGGEGRGGSRGGKGGGALTRQSSARDGKRARACAFRVDG